jgi:hypothetical protein
MFPTSIWLMTTIRISMRFNPTSYRFQTPFFIRKNLLVCNRSWWSSPVSPCPITDTGWHHELHRHPLVHPAAAAGRLWSTPSWSVPAIDSWTWPPRPSWRRPAAPGSAGEAQQGMGSIKKNTYGKNMARIHDVTWFYMFIYLPHFTTKSRVLHLQHGDNHYTYWLVDVCKYWNRPSQLTNRCWFNSKNGDKGWLLNDNLLWFVFGGGACGATALFHVFQRSF